MALGHGGAALIAAALVAAVLAAAPAAPVAEEETVVPDDPARFDELWDFEDPAGTEARFRELLPRAADEALRLQLWTQIARTFGLRRRFDEAHAVLDSVAPRLEAAAPVVRVRYLLERGRTLNSAGQPGEAKPLFLEAWETARGCGEDGFAVDAAHMVAIVETPDEAIRWNEIGLDLARASADPRAQRWKGSLLNNLAWTYHERGELERAHALFEEALAFRLTEDKQPQLDIARWCVARSLRSLGRVEEALAAQRTLAADKRAAGRAEDGYVSEELAECLLALGREEEARGHFARAHQLLSADAWLAEKEPQRLARLARLGGAPAANAGD